MCIFSNNIITVNINLIRQYFNYKDFLNNAIHIVGCVQQIMNEMITNFQLNHTNFTDKEKKLFKHAYIYLTIVANDLLAFIIQASKNEDVSKYFVEHMEELCFSRLEEIFEILKTEE